MRSKSFTRAKRVRCQTRCLARDVRRAKASRARSERRAVRQLLVAVPDDVPPILNPHNHVGAAAWSIA